MRSHSSRVLQLISSDPTIPYFQAKKTFEVDLNEHLGDGRALTGTLSALPSWNAFSASVFLSLEVDSNKGFGGGSALALEVV
jgi:hypothetical protein